MGRGSDTIADIPADRRSRFRRRNVLPIAVVGVLVIVVAGTWWASRSSAPPGDPRLYDSAWQLESASTEGRHVDVDSSPTPVRWQFTVFMCDSDPNCSDTPAIVGDDGCQFMNRTLHFDDSMGRWDPDWGAYSPQYRCESAIFDAIMAFHRPASFTYTFVDDRLRLVAGGDAAVLTFRSIPHWWPSED